MLCLPLSSMLSLLMLSKGSSSLPPPNKKQGQRNNRHNLRPGIFYKMAHFSTAYLNLALGVEKAVELEPLLPLAEPSVELAALPRSAELLAA